ncbi:hypothetical protein VaNZ11_013957 [Volvox africanus]|uniref:Polycomb protein VEFS-Box domain-containing protein n=1 Tax=Volvox africanus TaxID=51714 RepID=A0ABQ5SIJ8_9CHLO|nr:hypothetical protein VaNZ11_013957 [Volvox africanus]
MTSPEILFPEICVHSFRGIRPSLPLKGTFRSPNLVPKQFEYLYVRKDHNIISTCTKMETELSLGGNHVSSGANPAQAGGSDQDDRDNIFSTEFIDAIMLYTNVLPARALKKGPVFRRNCPIYGRHQLRRSRCADASTLLIRALQAANGLGAARLGNAYKGWLYVAAILCVEPSSRPNRLVPFPGSAWMLAFPPASDPATAAHHQQQQQQQQQQQENGMQEQNAVGVSTEVVEEAAAVAMATGWRPLPCDRQLGNKNPACSGSSYGGSSRGNGDWGPGGGGSCSLPLPLSDYDLQEASQIRLLLIYSDAVSDRASRLGLPTARRLESTIGDAGVDLAFNTFPLGTPVWAAVLAPTEAAAAALNQVGGTAPAPPTHGVGPAAVAPLRNDPLQWRATMGSVHPWAYTGSSPHTMSDGDGGQSGPAAARAGGKADLLRAAAVASCPPPAEPVGGLRVRMTRCMITRDIVWDTFNPTIHQDAPEAEVVTLALEPYGDAESGGGGGGGSGVALGRCGRTENSIRGGDAAAAAIVTSDANGVFVDLVLRGWTHHNTQTPHQIDAALPGDRTAAFCTGVPAATKDVAAAKDSGGALMQPPPRLPPSPSRNCRGGLIQQRRRQLLQNPPEQLDELVFRGNKRGVFWIWHAQPSAGDDGHGDDNSDGVDVDKPCWVPDSHPNPESDPTSHQSPVAWAQGGAGPSDPSAAPSPAPHEPGPRLPSRGGLNGGRGLRWGRELQAEASDNLRCGICKSPYAYDNLACLMAHVWSCHSQLTAALEYEELSTAAADDEDSYVCIHLMRCHDSADWRSLRGDLPPSTALQDRLMRPPVVKAVEEDWVMCRGRILETTARDVVAGKEVELRGEGVAAAAANGAAMEEEHQELPLRTHLRQKLEEVPPTGLAAIGDGLPLGVLPQQHVGSGASRLRKKLSCASGESAHDAIVISDVDDDMVDLAEVEDPCREDTDGTIFILTDEDDGGAGEARGGGGGGDGTSMGGSRPADGDRSGGQRGCGGSRGGSGPAAAAAIAARVMQCEPLAGAGAAAASGANSKGAAAEVNAASTVTGSVRMPVTDGFGSVLHGDVGAQRCHGRRRSRNSWDGGAGVAGAASEAAEPGRSKGMRLKLPDAVPVRDLVPSTAAAASTSAATAARMGGYRSIRRKLLQPLRLVLVRDIERRVRGQAAGGGAWLEADDCGSFGEDSGVSGGSADGAGVDKPDQLLEGGHPGRSLRYVGPSSAAVVEAAVTEAVVTDVCGGGPKTRQSSMHEHDLDGPDGKTNGDRGNVVATGVGGVGALGGAGAGAGGGGGACRGVDDVGGWTDAQTSTGLPAGSVWISAVAASGPSSTQKERHSRGEIGVDGKCDPRVNSSLGNRASDAGPSTIRVLEPLELQLRPLQPLQGSPGVEGSGGGAMRKRPAAVAGSFRRQGGGGRSVGSATYRCRALVKPSIQQATQPGLCQDFRKPRVFVHSRSLMPLSKEEVERRFNAATSPAATAAAGFAVTAPAAAAEAPQRPGAIAGGSGPPGVLNTAKLPRPQFGAMEGVPLASDSDSDTDDEEWEFTERAHLAGLAAPHSIDSGLPCTTRIAPSEQLIMFLWNRFARRNLLHSDRIMASRLLRFIDDHEGREIAAARSFTELRRSLVAHLLVQGQYGLIGPETISRCLQRLDELRKAHLDSQQ